MDTYGSVMLEGKLLNWYSTITYSGRVLRSDTPDDADKQLEVCAFVFHNNNLNERFGQMSNCVKSKLVQSY